MRYGISIVVDPGFSQGGAPTLPHMILPNFPKNCMKLKEFGRGEAKFYYVDPPPHKPYDKAISNFGIYVRIRGTVILNFGISTFLITRKLD